MVAHSQETLSAGTHPMTILEYSLARRSGDLPGTPRPAWSPVGVSLDAARGWAEHASRAERMCDASLALYGSSPTGKRSFLPRAGRDGPPLPVSGAGPDGLRQVEGRLRPAEESAAGAAATRPIRVPSVAPAEVAPAVLGRNESGGHRFFHSGPSAGTGAGEDGGDLLFDMEM